MGEEEATTGVSETVVNGNVTPTQPHNDVTEKKHVEREGVEEMHEDTNDDKKEKNKELNDKKDAEVSKDATEAEEKELKDGKEEEVNKLKEEEEDKQKEEEEDKQKEEGEDKQKEGKSEAMEVDGEENANEEIKNKISEDADLKEDEEKVEVTKETGSRERATKKSDGEKDNKKKGTVERNEKVKNEELKTPGPTIERPVRERKSVERLVAVIDKDTSREFHIEKGRGTALKDIPNVAYKLSKRKVADDTLKLLHTILFVRRGKALQIKSNILQFSGFVWHGSEEKHKAKVQEKLDKCNKEKLFEFCDLLDVPITKTTAKKEDVITRLIAFLLVPHATTSVLLAEKEQSGKGNKRKRENNIRASTSGATPSKDLSKKQRSKHASKEQKDTPETEDSDKEHEEEDEENNECRDVNGGPGKSQTESEGHASEPESGGNSKKRKRSSEKPHSKKESVPKTKSKKEATPDKSSTPHKKTPTKSSASGSKSMDRSEPAPKTFSRKKKNTVINEKPSTPKKSASKEKTGKKAAREKERRKEEKQKPSDDELRTAICEILKEVDFNTATFTDILKQLIKRFNTELTPRKASIKLMIQEELAKFADEEDEEDEVEADKTGIEASGKKT